MDIREQIKILADQELNALAYAQQCSEARRKLERAAGLSSAPAKGKTKVDKAVVVHITNRRTQTLLRKRQKG